MTPESQTAGSAAPPMLKVTGLSKAYGGITALCDVSFSVPAGCVVAIVGPNGAGKTTLFDVLTGMTPADQGVVLYKGIRISGRSIEELGRLGIGRTFQDGHLPSDLNVDEYLALATPPDKPLSRAESKSNGLITEWRAGVLEDARMYAGTMRQAGARKRRCGELPIGEQKFLIALRAILRFPDLLLLDEPTQNFSAEWTSLLSLWLKKLTACGKSALVISHDSEFAGSTCSRTLRMVAGRISDGAEYPDDYARQRIPLASHEQPAMPDGTPLLSVQGLETTVNGFILARGISLDISPGEIIGIVGPNGIGKSTLLKAIAGLGCRRQGVLMLAGEEQTSANALELCRRGISLALQGPRLPYRLRVQDAIELCWSRASQRRRSHKNGDRDPWNELKSAEDLFLHFPQLCKRRFSRAGVLSAGEQQLLAIAMAVASRPRLLLLDEPSVGLHRAVLEDLFSWFARLAHLGLAAVVVEQRSPELEALATRIFTLEGGRLRSIR